MQKTQLAAALAAVLGLTLGGVAMADDKPAAAPAADAGAAKTDAKADKGAKSGHHKKAAKGKDASCKGKDGSCKGKDAGAAK